jgi:hypothetical protein
LWFQARSSPDALFLLGRLQKERSRNRIKKYGSSTFVMGKSAVVAERHRKLARHNVPGKAFDNTLRPERTLETVPFSAFPPSLAGRISFGTQPGTLSLANFHGRFATARMLKKGFTHDKRRGTRNILTTDIW